MCGLFKEEDIAFIVTTLFRITHNMMVYGETCQCHPHYISNRETFDTLEFVRNLTCVDRDVR